MTTPPEGEKCREDIQRTKKIRRETLNLHQNAKCMKTPQQKRMEGKNARKTCEGMTCYNNKLLAPWNHLYM